MTPDERGSVTPLIIGFALILATLVAVVVDASAAYLRRSGMNSLADAAALSATDGLQGDQVYAQGLGKRARIDPVAAERYVEDYLARSGARATYPGLDVRVVTDDNVVRVRLASPLRLPLRVPGVVGESTVTGEAASEVLVTD
ncbi:MAG: hypothetical protein JWO46_1670 [Nocardioidaceae bacterium]|nr:hypothetical protein [Nocardioidaceae bacterium]